ncbi:MAG: hypothetical protein ABJN84_14105 [Flavobacteriaceae bacterium]
METSWCNPDHYWTNTFILKKFVRTMKSYPEYRSVQKCLQQIEHKLGWGSAKEWHNEVFMELSEAIDKEIHILLSPTTLKRVWGRIDYKSAPSISTLNALSQFAGYLNWRDFKNKVPDKNPSWIDRKFTPNMRIIVVSASIMTLAFISLFSMIGIETDTTIIDSSQIVFSSHPVAKGIPNSVVFDFDLKHVKSEDVFIQQYWDPEKTIKIKPGQKQATGIYYYPGYFRAKLLIDGKKIKQHDLFIQSDGWLGTLDYNPVPKYIKDLYSKTGTLSFSPTIIDEIIKNNTPLISSLHYIKDFDRVSGDNFILNTTLQNVYRDKWAVCQKTSIVILGTKSAIIVPFSIPGCVSEMGILLSETYIDGKEHDLSSLGMDLTVPKNLKIEVRNKRLTVFNGSTRLFSKTYQESIGDIAGVRFRFLGAGEVTNLKLTDINEEVVLMDGLSTD